MRAAGRFPPLIWLMCVLAVGGCVAHDPVAPSARPSVRIVPPTASVSAVRSASPSETATPTASPPAVEPGPSSPFGPPGTIVSSAWLRDRIEVYSTRPDGVTFQTVTLRVDDLAGWGSTESGSGVVSRSGRIALDACRTIEHTCALLVYDIGHPDAHPFIGQLPGLAFLPTGTAVGVSRDRRDLLRLRAPYTGAELATRVPDGVFVAQRVAGLSVAADGRGVFGTTPSFAENGAPLPWDTRVLVTWDGAVEPVDPSVDPYFQSGFERIVGADGESAFAAAPLTDPTAPPELVVQGPRTPRLETGIRGDWTAVWLPGGHELFIASGETYQILAGGQLGPITRRPPVGEDDPYGTIFGVTRDVVLYADSAFESRHIVRIDGSGFVSVPGAIAGVIP